MKRNFIAHQINKNIANVVGIATRYWLDDPAFEPRWKRDFPDTSRPAPWPTQHPVQKVPRLFPGGKAADAWR